MTRRVVTLALSLALLLSLAAPSFAAAAEAPLPTSIAAVGDSITQAASSGGTLGADYPANSWSTGTSTTVNSHYLRLLGAGAAIGGRAYNRSVSGAKVADLDAQMRNVVGLQPDYLTVLIGGNDLCTDTVAEMTSVTDFRARFETAMTTLTSGAPNTNVYVVSIPDVYQLWNLFKGNWWARFIWSTAGICQSLLANPTSTQQTDVQRRAAVRQRNVDFNAQLAQVCAAFARCVFDGNAVFNTTFTTSDVSGDYFHPSVAGQAKLAAVTWTSGYTWTTAPPPNEAPHASFASACSALACDFTDASTDSDGSVVGWAWSFGDGGTSTDASPSHAYAASGTYPVSLTVTDDDGATATASGSVTVSATTPTMHVADLAAATTASRNSWTASVTIRVADADGPLAGVSVSGTWSAGSGGAGCTTGTAGTCTVVSSSLNKKTTSVTYTVRGLARSGWAYDAAANLETAITVAKP